MTTKLVDSDLALSESELADMTAFMKRVLPHVNDPARVREFVRECSPMPEAKEHASQLYRRVYALTVEAMLLQADVERLREERATEDARRQAGEPALEAFSAVIEAAKVEARKVLAF